MKKSLVFLPINPDNISHCNAFTYLMKRYIAEMNRHSHRPLPEEFQQKWIDSILSAQGPKDSHLELCYAGNVLVGFLYGKVDHPEHKGYIRPGHGYIMEFYIEPEHRRKGYGSQMFHRLEAIFRADGVIQMYLTADPVTGKPFWEAMGFVNSGMYSPNNQLLIYERYVTETD